MHDGCCPDMPEADGGQKVVLALLVQGGRQCGQSIAFQQSPVQSPALDLFLDKLTALRDTLSEV